MLASSQVTEASTLTGSPVTAVPSGASARVIAMDGRMSVGWSCSTSDGSGVKLDPVTSRVVVSCSVHTSCGSTPSTVGVGDVRS